VSKTPLTDALVDWGAEHSITQLAAKFNEMLKHARRLETDRARLIEALKETIEEAESGLFRIEGGTDRTSWMCCCECYQAEWKGHKKDCKGALRITRYRALLKEMED